MFRLATLALALSAALGPAALAAQAVDTARVRAAYAASTVAVTVSRE